MINNDKMSFNKPKRYKVFLLNLQIVLMTKGKRLKTKGINQ